MTPTDFVVVIGIATLLAWVPFMVISRRSRARTAVAAGAGGDLDFPESRPLRRGPDLSDVGRRKFLLRGLGFAFLAGLAQFGLASIDFLFPRLRGGFGAKLTVGDAEELRNEIGAAREPKFISDGRFYLSLYEGDPEDAEAIPAYRKANVANSGFMALYRKCVHLGCSVPWCPPSKWFECPCHGSKYSVNGEYREGPAPRSLDQFRVDVVDGQVIVDTATIIAGAPRGTFTSQPQPEGANCVSVREG
ncbi:MAG: ubiquinol-cytochrome c reductase iron-sulfur subunit [Actinomycetota bacterium]